MPNIDSYLAKIREAVYGEEVRGSIHDALAVMNTNIDSAQQTALRNSIAPEWVKQEYQMGEYVWYPTSDGTLYKALQHIPSTENWTPDHWQAISLATGLYNDVINIWNAVAPEYSSSSAYEVGYHVIYEGVLYKCNTKIQSGEAWNADHWTAIKFGDELGELNGDFNFAIDTLLNDDNIINLCPKFERGDLYVNGSTGEGTYYPAGRRIRTVQDHPLKLSVGDTISTTDTSSSVFYIYKKGSDGKYTTVRSWGATAYTVTESGEYEIVARYSTEAYIPDYDLEAFKSKFIITKKASINEVYNNTIGNAADISELYSYIFEDACIGNAFECGDFYVDATTRKGYYLVSNSRMRTVQNHLLALNEGDTLYTNSTSNSVFYIYKKEANDTYTTVHSWSATDFFVTESGEYAVILRYPTEAYIQDPDAFKMCMHLKRKVTLESVHNESIDGVAKSSEVSTYIDDEACMGASFESGDLYVDGTTRKGTYYPSGRRVRTIKDHPLTLYKGDIVYTTDKSNSVFYIYKKEANDTYTTVHSWGTIDYVVTETGEYEILARYAVEAYIQDPDTFKKCMHVRRNASVYGIHNTINEKLDDLVALTYGDNSLFDYFEFGDLYVDSEGTGTYYTSRSRIRTLQDNPLSLQAGDIIYTTSDEYAFHVYKKELSGKYTSPVSGIENKQVMLDQDGNYEIYARYPTESTITSFYDIASAIRLKRAVCNASESNNKFNDSGVYDDELKTTINSVQRKTTARGYLLAIITDTHVNKPNAGYYEQTIQNLKKLDDQLHFNGIAHLGDIVNAFQESNALVEYHLRFSMNKLLSIDPNRTFVALGNHDDNHFSGDSERLLDSQVYGLTQRFNENDVQRDLGCSDSRYENRSSNFYIDYDGLKMRIIFIDSTYLHTGYSEEMITWLRTVLSGAPQDYYFVILSHCGMTIEMNGGYGIANSELFNALMEEYKLRIYCYICGHTHFDFVNYPHGFAQIALNCTVPNQPATNPPEGAVVPPRTIGTATQDCISILNIIPEDEKVELIRFGAGSDRTIPFWQ